MASSGKKSKKTWTKFDLGNVIDSSAPRKNWSEEVDDYNECDYGRKVDKVILPTAPRAARAQEDDSKIPQDPPYTAYLTNLSYDVNEDELINFFQDKVNVKVKSVNLPREEHGSNKFKGFGYVEFEDRASFVNVLSVADTVIKGRRVRIEVSTGHGDNSGRGGRGMRSGGSEPEHMNQDWRRGPARERDDNGYRSGGRRDYGDRGSGGSSYDRRDDRRGGYGDRDRGYRDRGGYSRDSDNREWSREGDRWRDDNKDRDRGGSYGRSGGGGGYDDSRRSDYISWRRDVDDRDRDPPPFERSEPKTRQKIALKPRTKPLEDDNKETDASAAIFGGAKPVNTAAREREIEERLARQSAAMLDDAPRRRGPSSHGSWDRARDRDKGEKDKDRGRDRDYQDREYEAEEDRDYLDSDRDLDTDRERVSSRGGDDDDDESRKGTPRRLEPAPPPKENPWTRRSQQNSSTTVNNGRSSPSEDTDSHPKSRGSSPRPPTREDSSSGESSIKKYQPPRGQSSDQKRGDKKPTYEERSSKGTPGTGRGSSRPPPKGSSQGPSSRPRESKKEEKDDTLFQEPKCMPKFQEQKAPNFAASNKFAYLDEASETAAN